MDPLVFEPYFRPQVWGGRMLETYLGCTLPGPGGFGEAWVLSAQELHVSRVVGGPFQGSLLTDLWRSHRVEIVGGKLLGDSPFPLLIKFLDCRELLSIQVHPSNAIALELGVGELGKTEAWVVLHAEPDARIYAGLLPGVTRRDLETRLDAGTLADCLHGFTPKPGDCVFLPAGVVHAVGGGVLMAEVQQSSDATFRLFDWNRPGPDGRPRKLHRDQALRSIDWSAGPVNPVACQPIDGLSPGVRGDRLVTCDYFTLNRYQLTASFDLPSPTPFSIWMVLQGNVRLSGPSANYQRDLRPGNTILIPATAPPLRWSPAVSGEEVTLLGSMIP